MKQAIAHEKLPLDRLAFAGAVTLLATIAVLAGQEPGGGGAETPPLPAPSGTLSLTDGQVAAILGAVELHCHGLRRPGRAPACCTCTAARCPLGGIRSRYSRAEVLESMTFLESTGQQSVVVSRTSSLRMAPAGGTT